MKLSRYAWENAMHRWNDRGDKSLLVELIRSSEPIPDRARAWIADVIESKRNVKRNHKTTMEKMNRMFREQASIEEKENVIAEIKCGKLTLPRGITVNEEVARRVNERFYYRATPNTVARDTRAK